jgi:hypothetical protein
MTSKLVAEFEDAVRAEAARITVQRLLDRADAEIEQMFHRQGGTADSEQVNEVYLQYGLTNEIGWRQELPLTTDGTTLCWPVSDGMRPEEARFMLMALGATVTAIERVEDRPPWLNAPTPNALATGDFDPDARDDDDEPIALPRASKKKTVH